MGTSKNRNPQCCSEGGRMTTDNLPYPPYDESGFVICQVCGRSFESIPMHLSCGRSGKNNNHKEQGIENWGDYKEKFPRAPKEADHNSSFTKLIQDRISNVQEEISELKEERAEIIREIERREAVVGELEDLLAMTADGREMS